MLNLNRAQILGNLTRDPELRTIPSGQNVLSFSVATNRRWRKPGSEDWQEAVEYHNIVAWGKMAEFNAQTLHKGDPVFVEGRLQTRSWDAQDGSKRSRTEINAERLIPLVKRSGGGVSDAGEQSPAAQDMGDKPALEMESVPSDESIRPEDIPF